MSARVPLLIALRAKAGTLRLETCVTTPWFSATFAGERHEMLLAAADAAGASKLLHRLDDHEFDLPQHWVADVQADLSQDADGAIRIRLQALTLAKD